MGPLMSRYEKNLFLIQGEPQHWTKSVSQEESRAYIFVLILSNWSHFYYTWEELTNL